MAKQSGLHQIRGKVGEHSYYRQSGVENGLIRRINQGMSNRVKTGAEFANTRLNNKEFKLAANMSKAFGSMISPKYRPMLLNFSQAKLTKSFLGILKQNVGDWGLRYLIASNNAQMLDGVNSLAKFPFFGQVTLTGTQTDTVNYVIEISDSDVENLISLGADGVQVRIQYRTVYGAKYTDDVFEMYQGRVTAPSGTSTILDPDDQWREMGSITRTSHTALTETDRIFDEVTITLMPYKTINGQNHILQELCSFAVFAAPARE